MTAQRQLIVIIVLQYNMNLIITLILSILVLPILCIIILGIANTLKNIYNGTAAIMRKLPMPPRYPLIGHIGMIIYRLLQCCGQHTHTNIHYIYCCNEL